MVRENIFYIPQLYNFFINFALKYFNKFLHTERCVFCYVRSHFYNGEPHKFIDDLCNQNFCFFQLLNWKYLLKLCLLCHINTKITARCLFITNEKIKKFLQILFNDKMVIYSENGQTTFKTNKDIIEVFLS